MANLPNIDFKKIYKTFSSPINNLDCGQKCSVHNPHNIPFCCDISYAVPAIYKKEWHYLKDNSDLWHVLTDEEKKIGNLFQGSIAEELPENMLFLACKGAPYCQRDFRSISCRQFPFFPYITEDFRFVGLAYEWEFENLCWVISHLNQVSNTYREEFIHTFDEIFNLWPEELESYAIKSEEMRSIFITKNQRIPILHRNGKDYLLSPANERMQIASATTFRKFPPYLTS